MALELIDETHTWKHNGVIVPGVTNTLKEVGILRIWDDAEFYRERGRAVHEMIHLYFDGVLAEPVPDWLEPYLVGLKNFIAETGYKPSKWEFPVFDELRRYAGRPDGIGTMRGQKLPVIIDWKTGAVAEWTAIQEAAYLQAAKLVYQRVGVSLKLGLRGGKNYDMKIWGLDTLARHTRIWNGALEIIRFNAEG